MGNPNITPFGQQRRADQAAGMPPTVTTTTIAPTIVCPTGCQRIAESFQGIDRSDSYEPLHYSPQGTLYKRRTSRGHAETKMRSGSSHRGWFWILIVIVLVLAGGWAWKKNHA